MKTNTTHAVDPAETCECNPEWSNASGNSDWDACRCSVVDPAEINSTFDKQES